MTQTELTPTASLTGKWKPYPTYKDSGVEWLGKIPIHWELWKVTHAFGLIGSGTTPLTSREEYYNGDIPWVNTAELRDNLINNTSKKLAVKALVDFPTLRVYPIGTLLVALYGATIGRIGILQIPAATNQACCALSEPKHLYIGFTFYWLLAHRQQLILLASGGGQPNISQDIIRSLRISAPPLPEQRTIAAFLDRETAKINALIEKKERLIKLLQEKRAALISHAVTKGLDPSVPMKDSGVEWLGEIPIHWKATRLKYIARLSYGDSLPADARQEGDIRVFGSNGPVGFHSKSNTLAPVLVIGRKGSFGKVNFSNQPCFAIDTTYFIDARNSRADLHWLFYALLLLRLDAISEDSAIPGLSRELTEELWLPTMPLPEQRSITAFLDREIAKIDALISRIRDGIEKLKEYSTALISAAVTGKIDVRGEISMQGSEMY